MGADQQQDYLEVSGEGEAVTRTPPQPRAPAAGGLRALARGVGGAAVAFSAGAATVGLWMKGSSSPHLQSFKPVGSTQLWNRPMPSKSNQYDGIEDTRDFWIDTKPETVHVFAVGDWGALLPGHQTAACTHGWDCTAQFQVANAMRARARWAFPQYILNVGDNFYLAGLPTSCNSGPGDQWTAKSSFAQGWQYMYGELANKPWISCLGNHDYGGWQMNMGWPQQIGYSFVNHNWIMPARYYNRKVKHHNFEMEYFVIDSNVFDAKDPKIADHNICSQQHNPGGASCSYNGGASNIWSCPGWFWGSYKWQQKWLEKALQKSDARWKVVVTHFPCGYDGSWYRGLHENYGLDLLVTGHRHQQELWWAGTQSKYVKNFMNTNDMGDLPCFVTGGGGGITAEWFTDADYGGDVLLYGFFDLTIHKDWMNIELVGTNNKVTGNLTIHPHTIRTKPAPWAGSVLSTDGASSETTKERSSAAPVASSAAPVAPASPSTADLPKKLKALPKSLQELLASRD